MNNLPVEGALGLGQIYTLAQYSVYMHLSIFYVCVDIPGKCLGNYRVGQEDTSKMGGLVVVASLPGEFV